MKFRKTSENFPILRDDDGNYIYGKNSAEFARYRIQRPISADEFIDELADILRDAATRLRFTDYSEAQDAVDALHASGHIHVNTIAEFLQWY